MLLIDYVSSRHLPGNPVMRSRKARLSVRVWHHSKIERIVRSPVGGEETVYLLHVLQLEVRKVHLSLSVICCRGHWVPAKPLSSWAKEPMILLLELAWLRE